MNMVDASSEPFRFAQLRRINRANGPWCKRAFHGSNMLLQRDSAPFRSKLPTVGTGHHFNVNPGYEKTRRIPWHFFWFQDYFKNLLLDYHVREVTHIAARSGFNIWVYDRTVVAAVAHQGHCQRPTWRDWLEKRRGKSMLSSIEINGSTSKMKLCRKRRAGCVAGDDYQLILVVKDAHSVLAAIPQKKVSRRGYVLFEDQTGMHVWKSAKLFCFLFQDSPRLEAHPMDSLIYFGLHRWF